VPAGLTLAPDGRVAFVANVNSRAVSVLDLAKREIVGTLSVGAGPDGMAWSPVRCRKAAPDGAGPT
jgi:YVTN family beta-propeller protein